MQDVFDKKLRVSFVEKAWRNCKTESAIISQIREQSCAKTADHCFPCLQVIKANLFQIKIVCKPETYSQNKSKTKNRQKKRFLKVDVGVNYDYCRDPISHTDFDQSNSGSNNVMVIAEKNDHEREV